MRYETCILSVLQYLRAQLFILKHVIALVCISYSVTHTISLSSAFSPNHMMRVKSTRRNRLGSDFILKNIDTKPERGDLNDIEVLKVLPNNEAVI